MHQLKWFCCRALLLIATIVASESQLPVSAASEPKIVPFSFVRDRSGRVGAELDLGQLPVGEESIVILRARNLTNSDFLISSAEATCSCAKVGTSQSNFPDGGELDINLKVTPSLSTTTVVQVSKVLLSTKSGDHLSVLFKYKLSGLLSFPEKASVISCDESSKFAIWSVPLNVSSPIDLKDISVATRPDGIASELILEASANGAVVKCRVDTEQIPSQGLSFSLVAKADRLRRESIIYCVAERQHELVITPSTMRVQRVVSETGNPKFELGGTAILRISRNVLSFPDREKFPNEELPVTIECAADPKWKLSHIVSNRISTGVYRVQFTLAPSSGKQEKCEKLTFRCDTGIKVLESTCNAIEVGN